MDCLPMNSLERLGLTWVPTLAEDEVANIGPLNVVRAATAEVGIDGPATVCPVAVVVAARVAYGCQRLLLKSIAFQQITYRYPDRFHA